MSTFFAGIGAVLVQMLFKLVGYELISSVIVIGLRAWSESTATKRDDEVVEAIAKALGAQTKDVMKLMS